MLQAVDTRDERGGGWAALPAWMFDGRILRRVLPVAQSRRIDDCEITLLSMELYEDGNVLLYRVAAADPAPGAGGAPEFGHPQLVISIEDDVGRKYESAHGGGGGGGRSWRGELRFGPALPESASSLRVTIEELQWLSHRPGTRSRALAGPWTFEITLK